MKTIVEMRDKVEEEWRDKDGKRIQSQILTDEEIKAMTQMMKKIEEGQ